METLVVAFTVLISGLVLAVATVAWMWKALQGAGAGYVARLDSQEAEIDDLRRQIQELREGRIADHALLQEWIGHARRLGQMLRDVTGQEPPPEPSERPRPVAQDLAALANTIAGAFSVSEIDDLAFSMGLDDALTGETPRARARSLVKVSYRRGLILQLAELCRRERPSAGL